VSEASWYEITNVADNAAEISITDEIGLFGVNAASFINNLKSLRGKRLNVAINSPGGEIFEGNAIFNALRQYSGGVDTSISALAASMASVIAMAGQKRSIAENGMFMIHNPWMFTRGESKDLKKDAKLLDDLKSSIITTYAGATGISREDLSKMMDAETWLTAREALDLGFVTEISPPIRASASYFRFDIHQFENCPNNFMVKTIPEKVDAPAEDKPVAKETPVSKEAPPAKETPMENSPVAKINAETSVYDQQIEALTKRIEELGEKHRQELEALELRVANAKHAESEAKLAKAYESLDRLERSYGMAAAKVIAMTPAASVGGTKSLIETYNEMPDGPEKSIFYNEHRNDLIKFANKPVKVA
jgi:ATP-dependent Clp endopeptidase proteolytic subunit ClpP